MKNLRWQILVIVLTLIVVAVLLLTQQPSATPILPEPTGGGIYTEALIGSFGRLNPLLDLNNPADRDIDSLIFDGLLWFDSTGLPQPALAESWGISADGTIYNLTLRQNAVWHDGTPVTSDDVMFTLSLLRTEYSEYPDDIRAMWDQVEITRLDDKNIKFVLPEPFVPFLDYLTFGILPRHLLESLSADQLARAEFNLAPVGSGPYQFDHLMIENGAIAGVVLRAAPNYYGKIAFVDEIVFRYYPDGASALEAYRGGEVLGISRISQDILLEALNEPNLSIYSSRMPRLTMVLLNLNNDALPFFQDKKIRQALLMGLNRQYMIDSILQGQGILADSPILPGTWAYYEGIKQTGFDTDAAIEILKAAGYSLPAGGEARVKDEVTFAFSMVYPEDALHEQLALAIQENWAALGVKVTLQPVSYEILMNDHLVLRSYDAALVDLDFTRTYDPDPYPFWHQAEATGGQNYSGWDNRTASEFIETARVTADLETRARFYRNFQVMFEREQPALLLFFPVYSYGVDQRVQGVQAIPLYEPADRFNGVTEWYLVTRRVLEQTVEGTAGP